MRQYSSDQVELSFFGADLTEGLAQGSFVQVKKKSRRWTPKINGVGGIVRMHNPDRSGSVTVQVDAESQTHQVLVTLANADALARAIVGPLLLRDLSTQEVVFFNKAFLEDIPDLQKSSTSTVFPWVFQFEAVIQQSFQFNANEVP